MSDRVPAPETPAAGSRRTVGTRSTHGVGKKVRRTSPLKILLDGRPRRAGVVRVGRKRASPIEGEDFQGGEGEESREVQEKAVRRKRRRQ